jgi:hypothetical protein
MRAATRERMIAIVAREMGSSFGGRDADARQGG